MVSKLIQCGLKAQVFHSPGQRPGYKVFTDNAPCKGNFNINYFLQLPLQGALPLCIRLPRALPWAMKVIGLSARFVFTLA